MNQAIDAADTKIGDKAQQHRGPRLGSNRRAVGVPCCPTSKTEKSQNQQGGRKPQGGNIIIDSQSNKNNNRLKERWLGRHGSMRLPSDFR
jgi:hypothetical protein